MKTSEEARSGISRLAVLAAVVVLVPVLTACFEYEKGEYIEPEVRADPADEQLADHNPPFDASLTVPALLDSGRCYLNKSRAVIGLDIVGLHEEEDALTDRVFADFADARQACEDQALLPSIDAIDCYSKQIDDQLYAALELELHDGDAVYPGGKQGLLADLIAALLAGPARDGRDEAISFLAAAAMLGGAASANLGGALSTACDEELSRFEAFPIQSKPVGFYTESETLRQVFRRDRLLQQPFGTRNWGGHDTGYGAKARGLMPVVRIAEVLETDPALLDAYSTYLRLGECLTNPSANLTILDLLQFRQQFQSEERLAEELRQSPQFATVESRGNVSANTVGVAFWPFTTSRENQLWAPELMADSELPESRFMDRLVGGIRAGEIDLAPDDDSGWYDYQLHALETLLVPELAQEAEKLLLTGRYRRRLRRAFEAVATQRRETHVKSVQMQALEVMADFPCRTSRPELMVEPAPEHYLRVARSYRVLRERLAALLGEEALGEVGLAAEGRMLDRLDGVIAECYGLYLISCSDIGLPPLLEPEETATLAGLAVPELPAQGLERLLADYPVAAQHGISAAERDARISACQLAARLLADKVWAAAGDPRVIVPVMSDAAGRHVRYWAVLGVRLQRVRAEYAVPPQVYQLPPRRTTTSEEPELDEVNAALAAGEHSENQHWEDTEYLLPVSVFTEITLGPEPPTREEYRAACDSGRTEKQILAALVGGGFRLSGAGPWLIGGAVLLLVAVAVSIHLRRRRAAARQVGGRQ